MDHGEQLIAQTAPFYQHAGFAVMPPRTQIEIAGADRVRFLNNYCTADIQRLQPGSGTEAFITSVKGKVLGHGFVFCADEFIIFETVAGQAEKLIGHLDRYTLADDVELKDVTEGWTFFFVAGPQAESLLSAATGEAMPQNVLDFATVKIGSVGCAIGRGGAVSPTGFTLCLRESHRDALRDALKAAGIEEVPGEALDALRIESGLPLYGIDITDDNLPQEANRNQQAISFTKGCYLGQETVARLDALGHVNKLLVGVKFHGETVPVAGAELTADDKPVGKVTSATYSPKLNAPLALAFVRTGHNQPGDTLSSDNGSAEVIALPLGE